ncbi:DNA-binding transcriptional regulator, HxlR family [Amycolatopsis xylanica]|uniref:DNA-binding transcriptional regulator, HxlR family n=1 Tax=Amycolatopsis xylanica TaxID=589385 RepID=A0A1H3ALL5_9PSEU|nr:helix-turn-helix domain-containing protein [Amycolatopsis xylanica]SDX30513.1 DNA-binding transcriptional regulator, HxlR family [Amycolatopsis xylanica]
MSRSYGQYCGLAKTLDVVGDRWNLLIVRQLLVAPARYRELQDGLPGIATNLLADRLRDLETGGVVERRLAGEGNAIEYVLTPWGAELREPIEGLIRWSTPLMTSGPGNDRFRPEWLVVALPALLSGRGSATVGIAVDGQMLQVCGAEVSPHDGRDLEAIVRADAAVVLGLAAGALTLDGARGLVEIEGDEAAVRTVFDR